MCSRGERDGGRRPRLQHPAWLQELRVGGGGGGKRHWRRVVLILTAIPDLPLPVGLSFFPGFPRLAAPTPYPSAVHTFQQEGMGA